MADIKRRKSYSTDEKVAALRILKENDYDYVQTSVETKIAMNTLKSWNQKLRTTINSSKDVQVIAAKTELTISKAKEKFIQNHFEKLNELTNVSINKALELVKKTKSLNSVVNVLKVVGDIYAKTNEATTSKESNTTTNTFNLIKYSVQKCNELKSNSVETEDVDYQELDK